MGMTGKGRVLLAVRACGTQSPASQLAAGTRAEEAGQPGPQPQEDQVWVGVEHQSPDPANHVQVRSYTMTVVVEGGRWTMILAHRVQACLT